MSTWGTAEAATRKTSGATDDQADREKGTTAHLYSARRIRSDSAYNDSAEVFRPGQNWPGEAIDMVGWFNRRLRRDREDGAALVEFALLAPLLLLLIFGMVDAGWAFMNHLEVRHGAREAARLAAVSADGFTTTVAITTETCGRMTTSSPDVSVTLSQTNPAPGQKATVSVQRDHKALVGFIPFFDGLTLTSTVDIRIEQTALWSTGGFFCDGSAVP